LRAIEARVAAGIVSGALLACGGPRAAPPGRSSPGVRATARPTPAPDPAIPDAAPALVARSRAEDHGTAARLAEFEALAAIPAPGGEALRRLAEGMADPSPEVRKVASGALSRVGPGLAPVLDVVAEALEHEEASVRLSATRLLASAGPEAAAAVPALYGALRDDDARVREEARRAIRAVRGR
jgi:HEAT repeat protein